MVVVAGVAINDALNFKWRHNEKIKLFIDHKCKPYDCRM